MTVEVRLGGRAVRLAVVVTDLDRTLTDLRLRDVPDALSALRRAQAAGIRTVLATGRHWCDIVDRPDLLACFDDLVLEGGAVRGRPGRFRVAPGAERVAQLARELAARGIPHDWGACSVGLDAGAAGAIDAQLAQLGLQGLPNHDRLDVTPEGVDKGWAVRQLRRDAAPAGDPDGGGAAGIVLAYADGANDVPLFAAADWRVAVANAHPALIGLASDVTDLPGGHGLAAHLDALLDQADRSAHPEPSPSGRTGRGALPARDSPALPRPPATWRGSA